MFRVKINTNAEVCSIHKVKMKFTLSHILVNFGLESYKFSSSECFVAKYFPFIILLRGFHHPATARMFAWFFKVLFKIKPYQRRFMVRLFAVCMSAASDLFRNIFSYWYEIWWVNSEHPLIRFATHFIEFERRSPYMRRE